jgi:hypothetical protein
MARPNSRPIALALSLVVTVALALAAGRASAQDDKKPKPKDDALENLLKEIKDARPPEGKTSAEKPADAKPSAEAKDKEKDKKESPADKDRKDAKGGDKPAPAKPSDVAPKDKALDSLLEKLGETRDTPTPDERPRGPGGRPDPEEKKEPRPGEKDQDKEKKAEADPLSGKSKDLDEHLEELTGRWRKKDRKDDEGSGPLSEVIKEMRDVEQRLGQPDTGEETRKKQQQIVKNLETLIEQMRSASSQSRGRQRSIAMGKNQQGQNDGQTPGTTGGYAPHAKPEKPTTKHSLNRDKNEWGALPPTDRQELENVFKEEFLTTRAELIRRYYESLAKKTVKRGE